MKILAVDIGTGTQDIFLYDSELDIENGYKLVLPSPTMIVHRRLKEATRRGEAVLLEGVTMGGGPSQWAAEAHLRGGLNLYATPQAARSFNDDLNVVEKMGICLVSQEEARHLQEPITRLELRDFDFPAIQRAMELFGIRLERLAAVAVAVFDHGNAPPEVSDRKFRFDYLDERIRAGNSEEGHSPLSVFAYRAEEIPPIMTRLQAVADSARGLDFPLVVMDSAPAAVLGATLDPRVAARERVLIANIGNFHSLAFRLGPQRVEGLFEHHTGFLDRLKLEVLLRALAQGSLKRKDVFDDQGHGALVYDPSPLPFGTGDFDVAVTGPVRSIFKQRIGQPSIETLIPYYAVPFGDMMLAGCFGLLAATADHLPELAEPLYRSLRGGDRRGKAPWDVED